MAGTFHTVDCARAARFVIDRFRRVAIRLHSCRNGYYPRVSEHPTDFTGSVPDAITSSIQDKMPDARVEVSGGGGHWSIVVVSTAFAGKSILESQRLVLGAIKHLINGANPPVHAVDSLVTKTP